MVAADQSAYSNTWMAFSIPVIQASRRSISKKPHIGFLIHMKTILTTICAFIFTVPAFAEQVSPEITVQGAVRAAREDKLSELIASVDLVAVATQPKHGMQPEGVVEKLKSIDLESVQFKDIDYKMGDEVIVVRMTAPLSLDFELKRYPTAGGKPRFAYRITSIHP